jgi:accessory gene regulator B
MILSEKCSEKLLNYITSVLPDKTDEDLEIIKYGLEILLMNIPKTGVILAIAYMLSILKYTLCTLVIFSILRYFAAGIHSRRSVSCLLSTLVFMLGTTYVSLKFQLTITEKSLIFFPALYVYYKYAPADTEEKPYLNKVIRQQLKIKSILVISIYFGFSICIKSVFFSNLFIHIIWLEALLISPITYKILKRRYNNYEYYKEII